MGARSREEPEHLLRRFHQILQEHDDFNNAPEDEVVIGKKDGGTHETHRILRVWRS